MTKAIEEAAREYANENMWYPGETSYESDIIAMEDSFAEAFKAGATHVLSLPLSQRLTDEERERVRKMYADIHSRAAYYKSKMSKTDSPVCITHHCNSMEFYVAQIKWLESIFGKKLFEEEGV